MSSKNDSEVCIEGKKFTGGKLKARRVYLKITKTQALRHCRELCLLVGFVSLTGTACTSVVDISAQIET